jgi:hypothetical protein
MNMLVKMMNTLIVNMIIYGNCHLGDEADEPILVI